jgi:hypothetical protein
MSKIFRVDGKYFRNLGDARRYQYEYDIHEQGYWTKGRNIKPIEVIDGCFVTDTIDIHDHFSEDLFKI